MTADNLTFSIEIDFIPDIQDGRAELKKSMKSVSEKFDGTYILDPKARPIISGLSKDDVEGALKELGLLAFGTWPACILTATIVSPLPIRAVGMSDGWDIYTGKKTFFAFAQFPADALSIMVKACTYYLEHESYQSLEEFIDVMGYEAFRDTVLGNTTAGNDAGNDYYGSSWGAPTYRRSKKATSYVRKTTSCRSSKYTRKWDPSSWNTACPASAALSPMMKTSGRLPRATASTSLRSSVR